MTDRRPYDPFAPAPLPPRAEDADSPGSGTGDEHESSGGDVESDGLDDMRRVDLVELAKDYRLPSYGTKDELIERIRKHRSG